MRLRPATTIYVIMKFDGEDVSIFGRRFYHSRLEAAGILDELYGAPYHSVGGINVWKNGNTVYIIDELTGYRPG